MTAEHEPLVSLVYAPGELSVRRCRGVVVGDFSVGEGWVEPSREALGYTTFLRVLLHRELSALGVFQFVTLDEETGPQSRDAHKVLRLEGKVTRFNQGSGLLRYLSCLVPFMELGATDFQVEGRLTEESTGDLVLEFVDRRRGMYNTPFGPNPRNLRDGFAMKHTIRDTAGSLAAFLGEACEEQPAQKTAEAEQTGKPLPEES